MPTDEQERASGKHECGLDITYCDNCGKELEVGQVGVCDECREVQHADR